MNDTIKITLEIPTSEARKLLEEFIDWYDVPFNNHFMKSSGEIIDEFFKDRKKNSVSSK